jgi:hypothetical protein
MLGTVLTTAPKKVPLMRILGMERGRSIPFAQQIDVDHNIGTEPNIVLAMRQAQTGRSSMRHVISASLFVLACALTQPASAQLEDKPVPMDKAPFHIPVFSNDYLILMKINIPPGRNTGYHTHYADSVSVNLTPASQTNQNYGSSQVSAPGTGGEGAPGRATFTNVTKDGPRTHKATNVGPTPFQNISFILKDRGLSANTVSSRSGVAGYTQIMDNARLRAWRVVLKPGEATGEITQVAAGLRVYIQGGVLAEIVPESADRGMAPYAGDFIWQDAGQTRAVKNTGTTLIEFVEFEMK